MTRTTGPTVQLPGNDDYGRWGPGVLETGIMRIKPGTEAGKTGKIPAKRTKTVKTGTLVVP